MEGHGTTRPMDVVNGRRLITFFAGKEEPTNEWLGVIRLPIVSAGEFKMDSPAVPKTVYLSHPQDRLRLIPFADYEGVLSREKLTEALRIVTDLGASKMVAKALRGYMTKDKFYAGIGPFSVDFTNQSQAVWETTFESEGAGCAPRDPGAIAFPDEPGFEALRVQVLVNRARKVRLEIQSNTSFGVGGELAVRLTDVGLKLGGTRQRYQCSYFLLEAEFPEGLTMAA
ncbi:unannotated protein [freshwater metagenome]|uniref:Unannotated protein n=1 Tax=freshwater metagenome TaxID=449393 RepID=A0A6J7K742_9ZZZZ